MKIFKEKTLGHGGNSKVVEVLYQHQKCACKILPKKLALKEILITKKLQNIDGIVKLIDVTYDDQYKYMILEKLLPYDKNTIEPKKYIKSIFTILKDVHSRNIIHNDVKFSNIMHSENGKQYLIDFGNSLYAHRTNSITIRGSLMYISPESLYSNNQKKSDTWAVGVIAYYLLTKKYPFNGKNMNEIFKEILYKKVDLSIIDNPVAVDFVVKLLNRNVEDRMSCNEALQHDWLFEE
jgi:myosin-light-chain kinase